jgi:hypothetical protein
VVALDVPVGKRFHQALDLLRLTLCKKFNQILVHNVYSCKSQHGVIRRYIFLDLCHQNCARLSLYSFLLW